MVSGGGSGHEPAHAGYVGKGMLDAAVAGNMFSSPSPDRIIKGIQEADSGAGVLLVIKNYSGDIMNFDMAREMAEMDGIRVESVVVRDDVAVPDSTYSTAAAALRVQSLSIRSPEPKRRLGRASMRSRQPRKRRLPTFAAWGWR